MNKLTSGILAIAIYLGLVFLVLLYYNVHKIKAKNYVEKNSDRVTVTLVNSDKTVFNRSSKITVPKKPTPRANIAKQHHNIVTPPKKDIVKRVIKHTPTKRELRAKELKRQKELKEARRIARLKEQRVKEREIKRAKERARREAQRVKEARERARLAQIAKKKKEQEIQRAKEARERARLAQIAKKKKEQEIQRAKEAKRIKEAKIKKERERRERARREAQRVKREKEKKERARLAHIKAQEERRRRAKERSKNLFASVHASTPKHNTKRPRVHQQESRSQVRHNSTVIDRIKNTHQSGRVSNKNRERGVVNAYISKVQKQLNNWNAQSNYKGQSATIRLTIMSSGHFRYRVRRSSSGALSRGLREFLDQLNRMGLGRHHKSSPYIIEVTFRAR